MPGFYRKKRRKTGPSKNEEKVRRGRMAEAEAHAAGTVSSRFPGVAGIAVRIAVISPQGVTLEESEDTLGPDDAFQIGVDCPGRCGSGKFDFAPAVSDALARGDDGGALEIPCGETLYGGGPDACGCVAKLEFSVSLSNN
jgi:hypothetical protein